MYIPAEDSYLLAEAVKKYSGEYALEIGVGSGIVLDNLCNSFRIVAGTDIHFESLVYCRTNISKEVTLVCCDAASALTGRFDLIVTNPPYLPQDNIGTKDSTIYGGIKGSEVVSYFIRSSVPLLNVYGKILIVLSNLSNIAQLDSLSRRMSLATRVVSKRNLFFETLYVFEISCESNP
ncbi:MAG: HemK2/MTQ2 family protein methyltransferase [Nitrososphaeraceae archaeon]